MLKKLQNKLRDTTIRISQSLKLSIRDTVLHNGIEHAGYLAFLFTLSLFPCLIFCVSIASLVGNLDNVINFINLFTSSIPETFIVALSPRIEEIIHSPPQSILTLAFIGIIWTSSSTIEGIRTILNRAYRIKFPPSYIFGRLLSILQFMICIIVIFIIVTALIILPEISKFFEDFLKLDFNIDYDWLYIRQFVVISTLILIITFIYHIITNDKQSFKNTFPGAIICVILFSIILKLFTLYLSSFNQFNLLYGSLAGIIGTLMFFFFIALAFITGAEFNYHFQRK